MQSLKEFISELAKTGNKQELYSALRMYSPQQAWEAAIEFMRNASDTMQDVSEAIEDVADGMQKAEASVVKPKKENKK